MAFTFKFKVDVLKMLKEKHYTSYFLRKNRIFSESTIQDFRNGVVPSFQSLGKLCEILGVDAGDLITYVSDGSYTPPHPENK